MRKTRLACAWLAALLALALVLAGCGQGSQSGNQAAPTTGTGSSSGNTGQQQPAKEKVIVYGRGGDSKVLDPAHATDGESFKVIDEVIEGLLRYKPGSTEVEPNLATEWSVNDDGTEWTFRLRQGVKFHDGTEFDAEAVKYNFDRWRLTSHPEHKGGEFEYYAYIFGGFDDQSVITDVQVIDKYTVKFVLARPVAPFLQNLAMVMFGIASPTAVKKDPEGFLTHPVGTGPFKFVRWDKGDKIVLEANPDYWGGRPKVDRIIFRSIPDNNARLIALQSGQLDIMDGIEPSHLPVIQGLSDFQIVYQPANNVGYLAMNMDKKPFDNPLVRQAINHAIDREAIVKTFFGELGEVAVTPLPPAMWGKTTDVTVYEYNPEKAKQLLAQAGYPNGFQTELWAMPVARPYMPKPTDIAVAIQKYLRDVGIEARIVTYDWPTYLDKTSNGEHTMALLGWIGDNGDPDNFLYVLLDKDNARTPGAGNIAFYRSDELHDLLIRAQTLSDQAERARLYVEAQKIIARDAPWVPLVHARAPIAVRKNITGFVPSPMGQEVMHQVDIQG